MNLKIDFLSLSLSLQYDAQIVMILASGDLFLNSFDLTFWH